MSFLIPEARRSLACLSLMAGASLALPAMAEFQPLDDSTLAGVTGPAGVTLDLETQPNIAHLNWTD